MITAEEWTNVKTSKPPSGEIVLLSVKLSDLESYMCFGVYFPPETPVKDTSFKWDSSLTEKDQKTKRLKLKNSYYRINNTEKGAIPEKLTGYVQYWTYRPVGPDGLRESLKNAILEGGKP